MIFLSSPSLLSVQHSSYLPFSPPFAFNTSQCTTFSEENLARIGRSVNSASAEWLKKRFAHAIHTHQFQSTEQTAVIFRTTSDLMCLSCFSPPAILAFVYVNGGAGYENFMPCLIALFYLELELTEKKRHASV